MVDVVVQSLPPGTGVELKGEAEVQHQRRLRILDKALALLSVCCARCVSEVFSLSTFH